MDRYKDDFYSSDQKANKLELSVLAFFPVWTHEAHLVSPMCCSMLDWELFFSF